MNVLNENQVKISPAPSIDDRCERTKAEKNLLKFHTVSFIYIVTQSNVFVLCLTCISDVFL